MIFWIGIIAKEKDGGSHFYIFLHEKSCVKESMRGNLYMILTKFSDT